MQRDVLDELTLRKYYMNDCYNQIMDKIRVVVQVKKMTTDNNGRYTYLIS
jgi:hypothetical protein